MTADNESLPTDTDSKLSITRIVIAVACLALIVFFFLPAGKTLSGSSTKNQNGSKEQAVVLEDSIVGLDIAAAFTAFKDEQKLNKDEISLLSDSVSNQEAQIKDLSKDLKQQIVDSSNKSSLEVQKAVDVFRRYIDTNATQFSGNNNSTVDIGGINFNSSSDDYKDKPIRSKSTQSSKSDLLNIAQNKNSRISSNYISFNTSFIDTANVKAQKTTTKGFDKVGKIFSDTPENKNEFKKKNIVKSTDSETILIDGSWVDAQLFHGLRCPIINAVSTIAGNTNPAAVTMMVRGIFHGPNGDTTDIGPVHIYGVCRGNRTGDDEYGIADIEIKEISYSMNGSKESIKLEGYVLDIENEENMNMPGLKGPIDAVQASTLADSAIAAALSVASLGFRATQTTTLTDPLTGKTASVFDGDPIKDALTQGLGGYFLDLHKSFTSLKDTAVDTVLVKSGSKIRIFTTSKFNVPNQQIQDDIFDTDDQFEARYL